MDTKSISVVVPVCNEEHQVSRFAAVTGEILSNAGVDYEIVFIDDGSSDNTWQQLLTLNALDSRSHGLRLSRNFGKEAALVAGLQAAGGDAVIVMDVDFQHPPALLPEMVRLWQEGNYKIVEAIKTDRGAEPILKRMAVKMFYSMMSRGTDLELTGSTDFKLLDREVVDVLLRLPERMTFFRGLCGWVGFRRTKIAFEVPVRESGRSRWKFSQLLALAVSAITSFSALPLHLITLAGGLFMLFALVLAAQTLLRYLSGNSLSGFTTVILLELIIGATCMFSLGVIGIYLSRLYEEVKARPRYIVAERSSVPRETFTAEVRASTSDERVLVTRQ